MATACSVNALLSSGEPLHQNTCFGWQRFTVSCTHARRARLVVLHAPNAILVIIGLKQRFGEHIPSRQQALNSHRAPVPALAAVLFATYSPGDPRLQWGTLFLQETLNIWQFEISALNQSF